MFDNINLSKKLGIIIILFIIGSLVQGTYSIVSIYDELLLDKKVKVKDEVKGAFKIVEYFYQQQETLGKERSQELAKEAIRALRFGKSGYVWINDYQHKLLMHPIKKKLEGKDMTNSKDAKGKYHWQEMIKVAKSPQEEGFVQYFYKGPQFSEPQEKASYVKGFKPWGWILGSGIYFTEVHDIFKKKLLLIVAILLVTILVVSGFSLMISKSITSPIKALMLNIKKIEEGDFTSEIKTDRNDEIGSLSKGIATMSGNLVRLIGEINKAITQLQSQAQLLVSGSQDTSKSMQSQHAKVQAATRSMDDMSDAFDNMKDDANKASSSSLDMNAQIKAGVAEMEKSIKSITELGKSMEKSDDTMQTLVTQSKEIDQVVEVISGISEQTNLLALNAAIEAARAGESGRGFAVVADEVRSLAQRTQESTEQIRQMIQTLQDFSSSVADDMKHSLNQSQESVQAVEKTGEELNKTLHSIEQITQLNQNISQASHQQSDEVHNVNENLTHIYEEAESTLKMANNITQSSSSVGDSARSLEEAIKKFKLP